MIYLDSCILIYAVENEGDLGQRARLALASTDDTFAISPLVMYETLVMPLRRRDQPQLDHYASVFASCHLLQPELSTYIHAAKLRAATVGLKTVDALHLAVAQQSGCTALWTNDRRLAAASGSFSVDVIGAS